MENIDEIHSKKLKNKDVENQDEAAKDKPLSQSGLIRRLLMHRSAIILAAFVLEIAGIVVTVVSIEQGGKSLLKTFGFELTTTHVGIVVIALGVILHTRALKENTKLIAVTLNVTLPIMLAAFMLSLTFYRSLAECHVASYTGTIDRKPACVPSLFDMDEVTLYLHTPAGSPVTEGYVEGNPQIFLPDVFGTVILPEEYRGKMIDIVNKEGLILASQMIPVDPNVGFVAIEIPE